MNNRWEMMENDYLRHVWWEDVQRAAQRVPYRRLDDPPDVSHVSFVAPEVFGGEEAADAAAEEAKREARAQCAQKGETAIVAHLRKCSKGRCSAAWGVLEEEKLRGVDLFPEPSTEERVRSWWVASWKMQALRQLLPAEKIPGEVRSMRNPETRHENDQSVWTGREGTTKRAVALLNEYSDSAHMVDEMNDLHDLLRHLDPEKRRGRFNSVARALRRSGAAYEHGNPHSFVSTLASVLDEAGELPRHLASLCNSAVETDGREP